MSGTDPRPRFRGDQRGFTLIELIMVMVLVSILSVVSVVFILEPFRAAEDIERRAALVDATDLALTGISREARNALPNSLRVHGPQHLEFITTMAGGRYRRLPEPGPGGSASIFVPARAADSFDILGGLMGADGVTPRSPGINCANGAGHCLSVFNTGQPGFDAYQGQNVAAIVHITGASLEYDTGGTGPAFATHSPSQRFFVIDTVVSYRCQDGQLRRFSGYGLQGGIPSLPAGGGELVADNVADCQFTYNPGTATRRGLLTLQLGLSREGESVSLLAQTQVMNAP